MTTLPGNHLVTVYEAHNETLGETYLGTTTLLSRDLAAAFLRYPPKKIRGRWHLEHGVSLRCIAYAIPLDSGEAFIRKYARSRRDRARTITDTATIIGSGRLAISAGAL